MSRSRLGKPWTSDDVRNIRELAKEGYSSRQAARIISRSRGSVAFKASSLGISFHSLGRRHSRLQKARWQ